MKQLTVLLGFALCIAMVIGVHFAMHCYLDTNPSTPPMDQVSESVDAWPEAETIDPFGNERSGKWPTIRNRFVENNPVCEACGSRMNLNVHHVVPFHVAPELELETSNLITLCAGCEVSDGYNCHFRIGHDPDGPDGPLGPNWKLSNPNVRQDAQKHRDSIGISP